MTSLLSSIDVQIQKLIEGKIDFTGQKLVERATIVILCVATLVSFLAGYTLQDLRVTFGVFGVFVTGILLALVPNWPYLNAHPVNWRSVPPQSIDKTQ